MKSILRKHNALIGFITRIGKWIIYNSSIERLDLVAFTRVNTIPQYCISVSPQIAPCAARSRPSANTQKTQYGALLCPTPELLITGSNDHTHFSQGLEL